jgi:hypothetical protein
LRRFAHARFGLRLAGGNHMKFLKSMFGVASCAALVALACDRREPIAKETPDERTVQATDERAAKPLTEPTLDLEPSAEDVSPTEAAGLAVANEAVGELRSSQRDIQLACAAAQNALNSAQYASGAQWADAKARAEQALRRAHQALGTMDADMEGNFPEVKGEVKGTESAPRGTMPKEMER